MRKSCEFADFGREIAASVTGYRARWRSYYANLVRKSSTSDHMVTTVIRSLPNGIGQGMRPMPDHLAATIRSLPGDNTGHSMISRSPGTGPVTGHQSMAPVTGLWYQ
ncbi:hypothetical protein DPMN_174939 [Dreissena polymorpha]|uniref:Uncharacterized protein n=1 Tax=Dreissena polymorpha TaxID=45954 RepID=A0A9D4E4A9_DREPO|nr:hypothetical protein DPMN_174939 [Dreissena polymorpha]